MIKTADIVHEVYYKFTNGTKVTFAVSKEFSISYAFVMMLREAVPEDTSKGEFYTGQISLSDLDTYGLPLLDEMPDLDTVTGHVDKWLDIFRRIR